MLVLKGVSLQQRAVREGAVTHATGEDTLHAVRAHVHIERAFLREAFAADGALERPHTRVHHHVLEQIVTQRERPPADAALVRLLTGVDEHVLAVVLARAQRLSAVAAVEGRLRGLRRVAWTCAACRGGRRRSRSQGSRGRSLLTRICQVVDNHGSANKEGRRL